MSIAAVAVVGIIRLYYSIRLEQLIGIYRQ